MTSFGHLAFFAEYLKVSGRLDALAAECPPVYPSPNAPKRDVPGSERRREMSRPLPGSALVRLSISATDEEWALAEERARGRGKSISRYIVDAALAEAGGRTFEGERGLLEAVRHLRPFLAGKSCRSILRSGLHERLAVLFAAWAGELAA